MTRPVFSPELGEYFQSLRDRKGWSQAKAIHKAARLPNLTKNVLWRLERGKIKQPSREVLMDIATLYEVPYEAVAINVAAAVYQIENKYGGSEHVRQTPSVDLPSNVESADGRQSTSVSTEERLRALEGGLQTILSITFGLLGEKAAIGVIDVAADPKGVDGTRSDSSRPSEGDHPVRARRTGARR